MRSTPVTREISCWPFPAFSRVAIVMRICGFKTFNSAPLLEKRAQRNVPPSSTSTPTGVRSQHHGMEEFAPASAGGSWVAAGARVGAESGRAQSVRDRIHRDRDAAYIKRSLGAGAHDCALRPSRNRILWFRPLPLGLYLCTSMPALIVHKPILLVQLRLPS